MGRREHPHLAALEASRLFARCSRRQLLRLADQAVPDQAREGGLIMLERHRGERLVLLVQGRAIVRRGEAIIATLREGDVFGELGLLDHRDRSATVVAATPVKMLTWQQPAFQQMLTDLPVVATRLREIANQRAAVTPGDDPSPATELFQ